MRTLYIVQCNEFYKVGIASNMKQRLFGLQTGSPYEIKIVETFQLSIRWISSFEKRLHSILGGLGLHVRGEWFKMTDAQLNAIIKYCKVAQDCKQ